MQKVLYFAYGSNMLYERIKIRCGKVKHCGTHKLYGYKLIFNAESTWGNISYANIIKTTSKKDFVEGVLYNLSHKDYRTLDMFEGLYERCYFIIDENTIGCTYVCKNITAEPYSPAEDYYLKICLQGAKENNLTKTIKIIEDEISNPKRTNWGGY